MEAGADQLWQENKSAVETLEKAGADGDELRLFLGYDEASPRWNYEAKEIKAICSQGILERLRENDSDLPSNHVAWLHERSCEGLVREKNSGFLSAVGLHKALQEAVCRLISTTNTIVKAKLEIFWQRFFIEPPKNGKTVASSASAPINANIRLM